jgi:hypothetical protein
MSEISPSIIKAYQETDYIVYGEYPFNLRIGIASEPLAKLYKQFKVSCAVFVTAFNPLSIEVGEAANTARQSALAKELNQRNLIILNGLGKHPSGEWVPEPGFFVLGLTLEAAQALGREYDQNAVVFCTSNAIPELILLR